MKQNKKVMLITAAVLLLAAMLFVGAGAAEADNAVPPGFPDGKTTTNPDEAVASITVGSTTVYYTEITAIMTSGGNVPLLPENSEVKLLKDVSVYFHNSNEGNFKLNNNVTFDGQNHTITVNSASGAQKGYVFGAKNFTQAAVIKDVIIDLAATTKGGPGINILNAPVNLVNVEVKGSPKNGVVVAGKDSGDVTITTSNTKVTATNLKTSNNKWGGVNVDSAGIPGVAFTFDSTCTFEDWGVYAEARTVNAEIRFGTSSSSVICPLLECWRPNSKDPSIREDFYGYYPTADKIPTSTYGTGVTSLSYEVKNNEWCITSIGGTPEDTSKLLKIKDEFYVGLPVAKIGNVKYYSIAEAMTAVKAGDTIEILVDSIKLPAINKDSITIKGKGSISDDTATEVTAFGGLSGKNVTLQNLNFTVDTNPSGESFTISNCKFTGTNGLRYAYATGTNTIKNCVFDTTKYGIHFDGNSGTVNVTDCTITGFNTFASGVLMNFKNCKFVGTANNKYHVLQTHGNMTLTGCSFDDVFFGAGDYDFVGNAQPTSFTEIKNCVVGDGSVDISRKFNCTDPEGIVSIDAVKDDEGKYTSGSFVTKDPAQITVAPGYVLNQVKTNLYEVNEIIPPVTTATAFADDYVYGGEKSKPTLDKTITEEYSFYYSTSAVGTGSSWDDGKVLNVGTYYVYAADSAGNQSKRTTFKVTQAPQAAPEFSVDVTGADVDVTIDNYDVDKKYEYELIIPGEDAGNDSWIDVKENPFTIRGLKASTDYVINLRVKASADGNYKASDAASESFTTSSIFSVVYNANGGLGKVPEAQESMTRVTVASPTDLYRLGYTFSGWNTQPDGSGTSYQPGASISEGAVLYAQWTGNKYTVTFDASGGTGTMDPQEFTYGEEQKLSRNEFTNGDKTFAGWAMKAGNPAIAIYGDKQEVQDITTESGITLYAVWVENTYIIHVTVTGADPVHTVNLTLKRGAAVIAAEKSALSTDFTGIPEGIYTLVADEIDSDGKIVKTITKRVDVKEERDVRIEFPAANVNSVVEVSPATVPVIADGITEEAVAKEGLGDKVTVTLNVSPAIEKELADTASEDEKEVQEAIALVKREEPDKTKTIEFISFTIKMDVDGKDDRLRETSNVIQLLIPFDFGAIKEGEEIEVSYVHNGEYKDMEKVDTPEKPWKAGTYYLDTVNNMIYINTDQFSVYAVSYKASSYSVTIQNTDGGTASADPAKNVAEKTKVTLTPTPDAGYKLSRWNVLSPAGLTITNNTFEMPASNVVIAPVWEKESSKRGSSGSQGSSYWATETPTATPTPTPTATPTPGIPTVKPTEQQTQPPASPVPLAGILAGLGAAAVVFGLRRR